MDEKEAIRILNRRINQLKLNFAITNEDLKAIETVLNLLEKKDKMIDLMAKCIDTELSSSRLGIKLNKNVKPLESYKKDIKQYFERKVENG